MLTEFNPRMYVKPTGCKYLRIADSEYKILSSAICLSGGQAMPCPSVSNPEHLYAFGRVYVCIDAIPGKSLIPILYLRHALVQDFVANGYTEMSRDEFLRDATIVDEFTLKPLRDDQAVVKVTRDELRSILMLGRIQDWRVQGRSADMRTWEEQTHIRLYKDDKPDGRPTIAFVRPSIARGNYIVRYQAYRDLCTTSDATAAYVDYEAKTQYSFSKPRVEFSVRRAAGVTNMRAQEMEILRQAKGLYPSAHGVTLTSPDRHDDTGEVVYSGYFTINLNDK